MTEFMVSVSDWVALTTVKSLEEYINHHEVVTESIKSIIQKNDIWYQNATFYYTMKTFFAVFPIWILIPVWNHEYH